MSISRYILPFFLVIISGLMYVLYVAPTYDDVLILKEKKLDYETAINNATEVRDLQAKLYAEVEAIDQNDRARLEKLLPTSYDPVLVLYDLNTFVQKRGLALKNPSVTISPADPKTSTQPKVTSVIIKFTVSAPYAIFRTFMEDMERELSLRDIKTLKISSDGAATGGGVLENSVFAYQIEAEGYVYHGKEKLEVTPQ